VRKVWIAILAGALAIGVTAIATGATVQGIKASVKTGSGKPKADTAGTLNINIAAKDSANQPTEQPDPARTIDFRLAKGLKLDMKGATDKCSATDTDFQNKGDKACSSKSQVATGSAVVNTGLQPPVTRINATVKGYNGGSKLVLYVVPQGAQPIVIRASVTGTSRSGQHIVAVVKPNCIPPGQPTDTPPCGGREAPIESFTLITLNKHKGSGSKRHDLVTTPASCPKGGWEFGVKVTFRSIATQDVRTKVPCRN
jgi:hypothetical protein